MATCKACEEPLVVELQQDDSCEGSSSATASSPATVPDDIELTCGCHFHWDCLLEESAAISQTLSCPSCNTSIAQASSIPVRYTNEGGLQELDVLPNIQEEAYLEANASARPARAFLTFCSEGDVLSVVQLMKQLMNSDLDDEAEEDAMHPAAILRYQDPLNGNRSAMHLAIEKGQIEVVWLLLWIASELPDHAFPANVKAQANMMGAARNMVGPGPDVRALRDERGCDADALASAVGGLWMDFVNAGFFKH